MNLLCPLCAEHEAYGSGYKRLKSSKPKPGDKVIAHCAVTRWHVREYFIRFDSLVEYQLRTARTKERFPAFRAHCVMKDDASTKSLRGISRDLVKQPLDRNKAHHNPRRRGRDRRTVIHGHGNLGLPCQGHGCGLR